MLILRLIVGTKVTKVYQSLMLAPNVPTVPYSLSVSVIEKTRLTFSSCSQQH